MSILTTKKHSWLVFTWIVNLLASYPSSGIFVSTNQVPSFSRDNFVVRFSPYVAPDDNAGSYDEPDLLPMVEKLSTTFSNVLAPRLKIDDAKDSLAFVGTAVAKFNKMHEDEDMSQIRPLHVFMVFLLAGSSDSSETNLTSFNLVTEVADKANSISPGTVEYLFLEQEDLHASNAGRVMAHLIDAQEKLSDNNFTRPRYKLGALFPLTSCGVGANLREFLLPLLDQLQFVVFHLWPSQEDYNVGVEETFLGFSRQFQRCKDKVRKLNPRIEVGFRSRWPDTDFDGQQNFSGLATFWERMNDWAVRTDTKVFMMEAFDVPFRNAHERTQGWWRLVSKRSYFGSADYVYESKKEAAIRKTTSVKMTSTEASTFTVSPAPPISHTGKEGGGSILSTVLISVITSVLILAISAVLMFLLYKKVVRKMDRREQNLLTKEEIQAFFDGDRTNQFSIGIEIQSGAGMISSVDMNAYNKEYELPVNSFTADEAAPLGMGTFGIVCRGKVFKEAREIDVAVKMVKRSCPSTAIKGLLSEIKVMSFLGKHEHVVSLIGAYTEELKKGKVYVFTELCSLGSLEKYLREYKPRNSEAFRSSVSADNPYMELKELNETTAIVEKGRRGQLDPRDLRRWSYEIVSGMEFLSSKHVVHADLATRNILLVRNMSAKISDFGLSRRLYDYTNYVKTEQEPLPWRWMAPESLRRLEFNEKTDVWAYGVTLWEIYSLGDVPYPGLSWSLDFATKLIKGLRLEEPSHNEDGMYTIMLNCWNTDPVKRPSFVELKERLSK